MFEIKETTTSRIRHNKKMTTASETKIDLNGLKTNMVLSRDILLGNGMVLLPGNTMLNDRNISKIKSYDIPYVFIKGDEKDDSSFRAPKTDLQKSIILTKEMPQFKEFEDVYEKKQEVTKETLVAIGRGNGVDIHAINHTTKDIMSSLQNRSDVFTFLASLKQRDDYTYAHSTNVSLLCNLFGSWLGLSPEETTELTTAGMLHDIGKMSIAPEILAKPGKLTDKEFQEMKKHTVYGYRVLQKQPISEDIKKAALMHHERFDGSGYPIGAKGKQINKFARIVAIADIYDAMTSERCYRERICPFHVIDSFEKNSYGDLDTKYLLILLKNIAYSYIGSYVTLSNGDMGEVVFINPNALSMPIVKCAASENSEEIFYDLAEKRDIKIAAML